MKRLFVIAVVLSASFAANIGYSQEFSNKVSLSYEVDLFKRSSSYGPWHMIAPEYSHRFQHLTLIGRTNVAVRNFGGGPKAGIQFEVDAYPKIRKGFYGYLNLGLSPSSIFPVFRFGAEPYFGLPYSFETSVGIRFMQFSQSSVFIFSGHVGKYYGNWWFSARPFLNFKPGGPSISGIFQARRYFATAEDYLNLELGYGSSPEELAVPEPEQFQRVNAYKAGIGYNQSLGRERSYILKIGFKYEYEEYRIGEFGHRFSFTLGGAKRF